MINDKFIKYTPFDILAYNKIPYPSESFAIDYPLSYR